MKRQNPTQGEVLTKSKPDSTILAESSPQAQDLSQRSHQEIRYSPNPAVNQVIHTLVKLGCPPIPVAPKPDPRKEWCHRVVKTKDGWLYCPIDKELNPIAKFTGKNPSFLDRNGSPRICLHGNYQNKLPTDQELKKLFCHPDTNVGTLGGHGGIAWIDIDAKCYESQEACDADAKAIIARGVGNTWIERTGSGGWRIAVKLCQPPTFTNFTTDASGTHRGEALYTGRYTVLAPSIHPNGNTYRRVGYGEPVEIENLESIGIFPAKEEVKQEKRKQAHVKRKQVIPGYGRTSSPSDNPWDIRNFAAYFEGYTERGEWGYAQCPHHANPTSFTSFRVNLGTGQTKLWCNCDPKDVWKSGLNLATSRGYRVPEPQQKEATINRDDWQRKFGHQFSDLNGWVLKLKARLTKASKQVSGWGFGKKSEVEVEPTKRTQHVIEYDPGKRLDTWGEMVKSWAQDCEQQGARKPLFILDNSATGTGKSFDTGMVTPELFEARQVSYASNDHRNPTVPTLKCWDDLEARHQGLFVNEFAKLRRVTKPDQPCHVAANCGRYGTLSALRSKNIPGADTASEICSSCKYLEMCRGGIGSYNYLNASAKTLSQYRFSTHPASLRSPLEYNYEPVVLVWYEPGESLKPYKSIEVNEQDLNLTVARLAMKFPKAWESLRLPLNNLHQYLSGEQKQLNKFGWNHTQITGLLPKVDGIDVAAIAEALSPDLSFLNTTSEHGVDLADLPRHLRKAFSDSDATTAEKVYKEVGLNWLPDFLDVLLGNVEGAIRIQHGKLTITIPDHRLVEIARAAKANIFLDATMTAEDLALVLGLDDPDSIITMRQATPNNNNLEVVQVTTMGRLGIGSRRKDEKGEDTFLQKRIDALIAQIQQDTTGKTSVIDFKRFTKDGDGKRQWWTDSRGVNDFEDIDSLVLVGVPCRNLADLEAEFTVLHRRAPRAGTEQVRYQVEVTGKGTDELQHCFDMEVSADPDFREFCRRRILADIHQAVGRLRAHRRPGQQLKVYFIADYPLDIPVTLKKASDITLDAGTKTERVEMAIRGAFDQLKATGQKITQQAIASLTGLSQGYISRFRELLQTLLEPINSKSNNSGAPPPDRVEVEWMGAEYLPLLADSPPKELLDGVLSTFEAYGRANFKSIWDATPAAAQVKILQSLMFTLSADELRSLFESVTAT